MRTTKLLLFIVFSGLLMPLAPMAASVTSPAASSDLVLVKQMGTMRGQVYIEGTPRPFALVAFFMEENGLPPIGGGITRVPEFLSRTDVYGKFAANILAGGYYIGILAREPGGAAGPPREGEKFYFVRSSAGQLRVLHSKEQAVVDQGRLDAELPETFSGQDEFFTVEGVVRDEKGNPQKGVVVLGKSQLNVPRPEFISERTDENGFYQLKLPTLRPFYLVARETVAGARPRPGTYIGTYGIESSTGLATPSIFGSGSPPPGVTGEGGKDRALAVSGGPGEKVTNADISMYRLPDPEVIKGGIQGTINSPKFAKGAEINNISFARNSYILGPQSYRELDLWVDFLKGLQDVKVMLLGHTDNVGSSGHNTILSKKRAQAVADYLTDNGIDPSRLLVKGYGPDQPVATNDTPEGRSRNRRVEIKFIE